MEGSDWEATLERLNQIKSSGKYADFTWRQNISVPGAKASKSRFESDHTSSDGMLKQLFLEDPDGHWIKIIFLPEGGELDHETHLAPPQQLAFATTRLLGRAMASKKRVEKLHQLGASGGYKPHVDLQAVPDAEVADPEKLGNLLQRLKTCGDICQAFTPEQIKENDVPTALSILDTLVVASGAQKLKPPQFLDATGSLCKTEQMVLSRDSCGEVLDPTFQAILEERAPSLFSFVQG